MIFRLLWNTHRPASISHYYQRLTSDLGNADLLDIDELAVKFARVRYVSSVALGSASERLSVMNHDLHSEATENVPPHVWRTICAMSSLMPKQSKVAALFKARAVSWNLLRLYMASPQTSTKNTITMYLLIVR